MYQNYPPTPPPSPETAYAQKISALLPALNLGAVGGGGTWYCPFAEGMARGFGFASQGSLTFPNTSDGGVLLAQTSAGAGGNVGVLSGTGTQVAACIANAKTEAWGFAMRAKIPATTANTRLFFGVMESTRATHNGLQLTGSGANTATLNLEANGNLTATSWALDLTASHEFMVTYDKVTMNAYVDNILVGSVANSANVNAVTCCPGFQIYNNGAASNEQVQVMRCFGAFGAS